ncbi:UNVERIFIED_CONTAM: hypothetical protein Sradi_2380700 [Sesamum radiatum]|uniref:Uncharacterized protein n=1 Tax=Sesamum radiatum TaxID=300843 RepID=A0AAW2T6K0_SESRA
MMAGREWISTLGENHRQYEFPSYWGVNAVRGFSSYDSYSESYDLRWQSHFNYWDQEEQLRHQPPPSPTQVALQTQTSGMSLEDIVTSIALTTQQLQQDSIETKASIQFLGNQISQLAMTMDKLAIQVSQELPSQIDTHPSENVSVITPQNGEELHPVEPVPVKAKGDEQTLDDTDMQNKKVEFDLISVHSANICVLSSPCRMPKSKEDENKSLNTSLKVKINIPVLELKALPYHLQCLYLGVSEILSNIIFQGLVKEQYELKLDEKEVLRSSKEKTQGFTDFIILKKLFEVGKKVLFYKFRLKLIPGKLGSSWLDLFESVNVFPHGVARLKSLDMRQIVKVNGHRPKSFLGGDNVTTIIGIVLASLQQLTH